MKKILWISRHALTAEQEKSLRDTYGEDKEIVHRNHIWQATADRVADIARNQAEWRLMQQEADVIAGVFPPVALEALKKGCRKRKTMFLTPISRQAAELRKGDGPIPFVHVRWAVL